MLISQIEWDKIKDRVLCLEQKLRECCLNSTIANLPIEQPIVPGLWLNEGVLTFFDGTDNKVFDFNNGELLDAFGNPTGVDF